MEQPGQQDTRKPAGGIGGVGEAGILRRLAHVQPPPMVLFGLAWLTLMLLADAVSPDAQAALDLRDRRASPVLMGCIRYRPTSSAADGLARRMASIRTGLSIGTAPGVLAAHGRGRVEQVALALVKFSACLPVLVHTPAMLAFSGSAMVLFSCLLGLGVQRRPARPAPWWAMGGKT